MRNGKGAKQQKNRERYERDDKGDAKRERDAADVQHEKQAIGRDPPAPIRQAGIEHAAEIGPDEEADDRRRQHILDVVADA